LVPVERSQEDCIGAQVVQGMAVHFRKKKL